MRDRSSAVLRRVLNTFNSFTAGQKAMSFTGVIPSIGDGC